ncbi:MAG: chromosome segregation protein SMC, partial [Ruminococcus sp.]|nr:chromosome segregation protein SMC [Ruminococcus sp.]
YIKQSEYRFSCESSKRTVEEETRRLAELREKSGSYEKTFCGYIEKINLYKENSEKLSEKSKVLKNRLSECEKLCETKKSDFEQAKKDFESVLYELREKEQRRKILHDLDNNMEGFAGSVKSVLRASKQGRINGVFGTVAQNTGVEQKYALAVETALGGAMQNIIVENEETAKQCINFLREQKGGRATFLPVTSVKGRELNEQGLENCTGFEAVASQIVDYDLKFSGIMSSLLGRTVIAENIDCAVVIAKKYGYRFRIVTLDGQVINAGGSFTGGSAQKTAGIITRKNEIDRLDSEIARLSADRDGLREKAEKLRAESEKIRIETENIKSSLSEYGADIARLDSGISTLELLSEQVKSQTENSVRLIDETEKKIRLAENTIETAEKNLADIYEKIQKAEQELAQGQDIREKLRRSRTELSEKLSHLKIRETELVKDIQAHEGEILRVDASFAELERTKRNFSNEIKRLESEINEKKSETEKIRLKLESLKDNTDVYLNQIKQYQAMHTEQNRLVNEIQRGLKETNAVKEKFSGEITRLEERRANVSRDSDNIIRQLLEVYELTRSEAVQIAVKIDNMAEAQKPLSDVKNKIRALGSVNVDAIEEYKEVSERYRFMSEQIADIRKSKAELEKIISGLTEEMCRIFAESFEIINSNFKEIFTELFGGGKAELVLTDPENVLESGIEIIVAPPGKVIKNLISLSGGEQSFVAIAIYFAILKLRPAPFCILDEIDAALDEVNVRKYAQYLKNFTDTTQFVLVTHRRSAMEEANVLYGVTMQEDGISKLLKMEQVDFQEDIADIH